VAGPAPIFDEPHLPGATLAEEPFQHVAIARVCYHAAILRQVPADGAGKLRVLSRYCDTNSVRSVPNAKPLTPNCLEFIVKS
jgi:hypothetical protein